MTNALQITEHSFADDGLAVQTIESHTVCNVVILRPNFRVREMSYRAEMVNSQSTV